MNLKRYQFKPFNKISWYNKLLFQQLQRNKGTDNINSSKLKRDVNIVNEIVEPRIAFITYQKELKEVNDLNKKR